MWQGGKLDGVDREAGLWCIQKMASANPIGGSGAGMSFRDVLH